MTRRGQLALVLHAHLPYVRHPEHERFLEEHWLFEAIVDCYLPLLEVLRAAEQRGTQARLCLSLSPTLLSQLTDPLLQDRFLDYFERRLSLCTGETKRRGGDMGRLAHWYQQRLTQLRDLYLNGICADLVGAWLELCECGLLELMTTAATHGYLPLLRSHESSVRSQLRVGRDAFRAITGRYANGLWLPECGYYPGLEREISEAGYDYTVLETHGIQQGTPRPLWDVYAPVSCRGLALFGRDPLSAQEVWSRETGYPGHRVYREYHRDLGFEAEEGVLDGFLPPGIGAAPSGVKYYRVTGGKGPKALYDPRIATERAVKDANRFIDNRRGLIARFPQHVRPPLIVAPYDAELFGHWWFEGPVFLDALIRKLDQTRELEMVTLGKYLECYGPVGSFVASASSWGEQGYNQTWLRPDTGWVHMQLHQAAETFNALMLRHGPGRGDSRELRLLRQAARSLLLAQSSDWTFHLGRGGGADYAQTRLSGQLSRFAFLADALRQGRYPDKELVALEWMDNLFPELDLTHFGDSDA